MTDPEIAWARLTSGDAGAVRAQAALLTAASGVIDEARGGIEEAAGVPRWSGLTATAFDARAASMVSGADAGRAVLDLVAGGVDTAATAYDRATAAADHYISFWRDRPRDLPPHFEELLARAVDQGITRTAQAYDRQLAAVAGVMTGSRDDLDLDALDDEIREWVEDGLERTDDWLDSSGSELGPVIPNTAATGDGRNLTPQGLGFLDQGDGSGSLLQAYNDEDSGDLSGIAVIDSGTGEETGEVSLGGMPDRTGLPGSGYPPPDHVGGVTVDGDNVIVTSEGRVYTYPRSEIENPTPGQPAVPSNVTDVSNEVPGSYAAMHGDQLYVGDFENGVMQVYDRDGDGGWTPATDSEGEPITIDTPPNVQGVVVRDDEIVYSTSHGRGGRSQIIVEDHDGNQISTTTMPNMSQGIVEVDDELITTYESGAEKFDTQTFLQRLQGPLWANPFMTRTPMEDLLEQDYSGWPYTLVSAANVLGDPAASFSRAGSILGDVSLPATALGEVPNAARLAAVVEKAASLSAESARMATAGVDRLGEGLRTAAKDLESTDGAVAGAFGSRTPW